jgi:Uma2 family endonuclease
MSTLAYKLEEIYTYADYLFWDESDRYEIIDGIAYAMASPTARHQGISSEIHGAIWEFLKGKPCKVFAAPFDVRLFPEEDGSDTTVVQPDILVVSDSAKLADGKACKGAPDLIVEILSASSVIMDRKVKAEKYREAGVKEYWIVDADSLNVLVNLLGDGRYAAALHNDCVRSSVLPGMEIDLNTIRANIPA